MGNERYRGITQIPRAEAFRLYPSAFTIALDHIKLRLRNQLFRSVPLSCKSIDIASICFAVLGVDGVFVSRGSASYKRTICRVRARDRAIRNAVIVDIEIAAELAAKLLERFSGGLTAAVMPRKISR